MGTMSWNDQEVEARPRQKARLEQGDFCVYCDGKGWIEETGKCDLCRGTGRIVRKVR